MSLNIAIQVSSLGQRCGIYTYAYRLEKYLNKLNGINAFMFAERIPRDKKADVISLQYEPGLMRPQTLDKLLQKYVEPIIITAHHTGYLEQFFQSIDGLILHSESQLKAFKSEPWDYRIIPHPAIVFPKKDKKKLRRKYGLPTDMKILGTAGFIAGTGKRLPEIARHLLKELADDEYLYFITSYWKGGDFGYEQAIRDTVKRYGKENQFRIDTDFVPEQTLNEKMQCCDLLFAWSMTTEPGSASGVAMDMIGSYTKLIVKDSPHYSIPASIDGVEVGRADQKEFAEDVLKLFRTGDLSDIPDPRKYSWENLVKDYVEYFEEFL